jgi:hypothetical protein
MNPLHASSPTSFIDLSVRTRRRKPATADVAISPNDAAARYDATARALGVQRLRKPVAIDSESARWSAFLELLDARVAAGSVTAAQRSALLRVWGVAHARRSSLRRPAVAVSEDGSLSASWSFVDLPGRVFSLQIHPDGAIDWFYRDVATDTVRGSEDALPHELPVEALELLVVGFGATTSGSR